MQQVRVWRKTGQFLTLMRWSDLDLNFRRHGWELTGTRRLEEADDMRLATQESA